MDNNFNCILNCVLLHKIRFGNPFQFADNLWESFQEKINAFVNENSGKSTINNPSHERLNWEKVRDVLEGISPVSDLGCN